MSYSINRNNYKLKIGSRLECLCLVCHECNRIFALGNYEMEPHRKVKYSEFGDMEFVCRNHGS